jgi:hypothetical protein
MIHATDVEAHSGDLRGNNAHSSCATTVVSPAYRTATIIEDAQDEFSMNRECRGLRLRCSAGAVADMATRDVEMAVPPARRITDEPCHQLRRRFEVFMCGQMRRRAAYSDRSAWIGSVREARQAGIAAARTATARQKTPRPLFAPSPREALKPVAIAFAPPALSPPDPP